MKRNMLINMAVDPVTGLDEGEEAKVRAQLATVFAENSITPIYQGGYWSFTSTIMNKSNVEAQIELNKWKTRGLDGSLMKTIAKNIANKDLTA